MEALSPEWRTRCTHLNDPFADMLRWLGEIAGGAPSARWQVVEEGFATQFIYMPPGRNSHGESCGVLVQTGLNEAALYYSWACSIDPERLVSEVYTAFRGFVESAAYRPEEWEWNGVNEDDFPELFDLDTEVFKFFEARFPIWTGHSLGFLRSARVEAFLAGRAPPAPRLSQEAVGALLEIRTQLAAIERDVLPLCFFRGPTPFDMPPFDTPRFDASGAPSSDGAYGPVWRRMWWAFEMAGAAVPAKSSSGKGARKVSDERLQRPADTEDCASLSWMEIAALLAAEKRRALAGENDAPAMAEVRFFDEIAQRLLYLEL